MYRPALTAEEQARIFGTVEGAALDDLLERAAAAEGSEDAASYIQEASGCFIGEDFLQAEIVELRGWAKSKRGQNKKDFLDLIERIEQVIEEAAGNADHGADELKKAHKALIGAA